MKLWASRTDKTDWLDGFAYFKIVILYLGNCVFDFFRFTSLHARTEREHSTVSKFIDRTNDEYELVRRIQIHDHVTQFNVLRERGTF